MVDWNRPIVAVLRDERFQARVVVKQRHNVLVEIVGPHSVRASHQIPDSEKWWFHLDGRYCSSGRKGEFVHIENDK